MQNPEQLAPLGRVGAVGHLQLRSAPQAQLDHALAAVLEQGGHCTSLRGVSAASRYAWQQSSSMPYPVERLRRSKPAAMFFMITTKQLRFDDAGAPDRARVFVRWG